MKLPTLIATCLSLALTVQAQFYYPDSRNYGSPADYGLAFDDLSFESKDGTALHGWHIKTKSKHKIGTIIHFHGNAQNITSHFRGVAWLADHGYDLFLFDYRGFGKSAGKPDQAGVFMDCVASVNMAQHINADETTFILYGQSLGAANAIAVAGEIAILNLKGVIAEAPFYSYESIARDKVNGFLDLFVGIAISDKKSPHLVVANIAPVPLLLVHGNADQVVPFKHSKALYEKAQQPKSLWEVPSAQHLRIFTPAQPQNRARLIEILNRMIAYSENAPEGLPTPE